LKIIYCIVEGFENDGTDGTHGTVGVKRFQEREKFSVKNIR